MIYFNYLLTYCKSKNYYVSACFMKAKKIALLRSPHVHKKSREHFEVIKFKSAIEIVASDSNLALKKLFAFKPIGILMRIKMQSFRNRNRSGL